MCIRDRDKSYLNVCFVNDPKMQSMAETILMTPTHTAENVKEWVEYMNEQMYAYGMFNVFSYVAASNSIESITWTFRACVYPVSYTHLDVYKRQI